MSSMKDIKIAYIGGGSHNWARVLMNDFYKDDELKGEVRLYDINFDAAKDNEIIANDVLKDKKWKYKAVKTIQDALTGADFVFISILPGTFEDMKRDVHTPEKYGIFQSVGDTVGFGGITRAWRTVPMIAEIAKAVEKYSPKAWVINFTNPMSVCVKTLFTAFPKIKAYGCCHEVFHTQGLLKNIVEKELGIHIDSFKDIKTNVLGINHFTFFDKATYRDIDIFPVYKKFVDENFDKGFEKESNHWFNNHFESCERVKFDLFRRYDVIFAAGDRHLSEFVDNSLYLQHNMEWKFKLTPVDWRISNREELIQKTKQLISGEKKFELFDSGEDFVRQIKALLGYGEIVSNVNLLNKGQIENMRKDAVTETNAVFCSNGVFPVYAGSLPDNVIDLYTPHVDNQFRIVEASIKRDKALLFEAFKHDPQSKGFKENDLRSLFEEMLG